MVTCILFGNYDDKDLMETVFAKSIPVVETIKPMLPQYHTRAMKRALFVKFGRVAKNINPAILRAKLVVIALLHLIWLRLKLTNGCSLFLTWNQKILIQ